MPTPAKTPVKDPSEHGLEGFQLATGKIEPRLTISTYGPTKAGKTNLIITAPDPIAVIALDTNTKIICEKAARDNNKKIYVKEFLKGPLSQIDDINVHKKFYREIRETYYRLIENKSIRTIAIDTGSQLYEDARYAHLGRRRIDTSSEVNSKGEPTGTKIGIDQIPARDYGPVRQDLRDLINSCEEQNLVITHRSKELWQNNKPTGEQVADGMPGIGYLAQVDGYQWRDNKGEFHMLLQGSTANGDIRGRKGEEVYEGGTTKYVMGADELIGEDVCFLAIALAVYPDSEAEDWI